MPFLSGHVAYRDTVEGSWFIQDLVDVFMDLWNDEHIFDMLTEVKKDYLEIFISTTRLTESISTLWERRRNPFKVYYLQLRLETAWTENIDALKARRINHIWPNTGLHVH